MGTVHRNLNNLCIHCQIEALREIYGTLGLFCVEDILEAESIEAVYYSKIHDPKRGKFIMRRNIVGWFPIYPPECACIQGMKGMEKCQTI